MPPIWVGNDGPCPGGARVALRSAVSISDDGVVVVNGVDGVVGESDSGSLLRGRPTSGGAVGGGGAGLVSVHGPAESCLPSEPVDDFRSGGLGAGLVLEKVDALELDSAVKNGGCLCPFGVGQ